MTLKVPFEEIHDKDLKFVFLLHRETMSQKPSYTAPAWSALPSEKFELEVLKEGSIVGTIPLGEKEYFTLGRQHGLVDIPMDHLSVSRMHAVLNFRDDGALMLRDLGSAQGTLLNKILCEKDTYYRVYVGDLIKFGASTRQYIVSGPEEQRRPEYDSVNLEIYRDKLAARSAEIKLKLEKEEEKNAFSWGMRDDAEQPDEEAEQNEEELPDYLKKMKNDEHFDRKFGDKFSANINETEAKNAKDTEILEKIRKKERKIQNMQEENRRIYMKEGSQDGGLTAGQAAAVGRNDKSIASLEEEVAQLVGQIRAKAADRSNTASGDAATGSKRAAREADDDDDVLDLSGQTADASTNWRLRKKLQKTVHLTTGAAGVDVEQKSLSYADIKQQLSEQVELSSKIALQIESTNEFLSSQEAILSGVQGDQLESVMARDRIGDSKASLKSLLNEQASVEMRVNRLQKLLQVATPALSSLVNKKPHVSEAVIASVKQASGNESETDSSQVLAPPVRQMLPMNALPESSKAQISKAPTLDNSTTTPVSEADKLSALVRFIEEEKAAEEAALQQKEQVAKDRAAAAAAALAQATASSSTNKTPTDGPSVIKKGGPAPTTSAGGASKGAIKGPTMRPSSDTARYDASMLEGGEAAWVPPPKQTGDGKTALNAKYGY